MPGGSLGKGRGFQRPTATFVVVITTLAVKVSNSQRVGGGATSATAWVRGEGSVGARAGAPAGGSGMAMVSSVERKTEYSAHHFALSATARHTLQAIASDKQAAWQQVIGGGGATLVGTEPEPVPERHCGGGGARSGAGLAPAGW